MIDRLGRFMPVEEVWKFRRSLSLLEDMESGRYKSTAAQSRLLRSQMQHLGSHQQPIMFRNFTAVLKIYIQVCYEADNSSSSHKKCLSHSCYSKSLHADSDSVVTVHMITLPYGLAVVPYGTICWTHEPCMGMLQQDCQQATENWVPVRSGASRVLFSTRNAA